MLTSDQLILSCVPERTTRQPQAPAVFSYDEYMAEKEERDLPLEASCAAKRAKTAADTNSQPTKQISGDSSQTSEVSRLVTQLDEKNKECERLKRQVDKLHQASVQAAENQLTVTENFYR